MAFCFGDGFDLYAATADAVAGYWDSGSTANFSLQPGRFSGSQSVMGVGAIVTWLVKNSGSNDAVHHITVAVKQSAAITGTAIYHFIKLSDGATDQCSIVFRSDGAILLTSGNQSGTTLATYTGAITLQNQWFAFEFEVVINNTTGSFKVRTNGASSDSFSATGLNTRGGTANNYANRLSLGNSTNNQMVFDDLLWRSDAASVSWVGDVRCYTRMPASDASVQFSRSTGATNFSCVDEATQNGVTDYVFDSVVGDADFYGIASIGVTPASVVAVTTRGFVQKSDAGSRSGQVQLKSSGTTVGSTPAALSTTFGWMWRTDTVDPNTSAAWTPTSVNNVTIGPKLTA